ncbi:hypothetical protein JKP88DRAFT_254122 [Tribonema minus]|uniref:NrS-1 polymerase-like helicase domain-containing protein n=1 Tax=Tribonema minus TaxID=303371 RepID=A0A835Z413_9STRA|nr:hypothetical protein JKP88DRAFT_254122 [Tribonema minus]
MLHVPKSRAFTLRESVDVDVLRFLLATPDATMEATSYESYVKLAAYASKVDADGRVSVKYEPVAHGYGRRFAYPSLQNTDRVLRHAVCRHTYDNDIVNANFTLLQGLCQIHGLEHEKLTHYNANREAVLEHAAPLEGETAADLKLSVIKMIGGGFRPKSEFLREFKLELKRITRDIVDLYPQFKAIKQDSDNPYGSAICLLLNSLESWAVDVAMPLWHEQDLCASIFDGLHTCVRVPPELHRAAESAFLAASGISIQWRTKSHPDPIWKNMDREHCTHEEVYDKCTLGYEGVKASFERTVFKCKRPYMFCEEMVDHADDCTLNTMRKNDFENMYCNKYYWEVRATKTKSRKSGVKDTVSVAATKKPFMKDWMMDEDIRTFDYLDFLPPPLTCPSNVYNCYYGFAVARLPAAAPTDVEDLHGHVLPFMHDIMCNGNDAVYQYVLKDLANRVQQPGKKTTVALSFLGDEGVGKNFVVNYIYVPLMGKSMCSKAADLEHSLFGRFSCPGRNNLLVCLDEIRPAEMARYYDQLMDLITAEMSQGELKGIQGRFNYTSCARYIFTSNHMERLVRIRPTDRKYQFISFSDARINDVAFFNTLGAILKRDGVRRALYDFFMNIDISGFNFITQRVPLQEYIDAKMLAVRRELVFLRDKFLRHPEDLYDNVKTNMLFSDFMTWNKEKAAMGSCAEYSSTTIGFGMFISKVKGFVKAKRVGNLSAFTVDVPAFLSYMRSIDLYSADEAEYITMCEQKHFVNACKADRWVEAKDDAALMKWLIKCHEDKEFYVRYSTFDEYERCICACGATRVNVQQFSPDLQRNVMVLRCTAC